MEDTTRILFEIFVALAAAHLLGSLFAAFKQPPLIGELLAGAILGPALLGLIHQTELLEALGQLGMMLLLFVAGLETHVGRFVEAGPRAARVAALGAIVPFAGGVVAGLAFRYGVTESLFVGTALMATSVGVTMRVIRDLGLQRRRSLTIVLGAAIFDDVLGLLTLGIVTAIALGGANPWELALLVVEVVVFLAAAGFAGPRLARRFSEPLARLSANALFMLAVLLMLGLSLLAQYVGLAAIIGAFIAGLIVSEVKQHAALEDRFTPLAWFFVPFFFVLMGTYIAPASFAKPLVLAAIVAFSVVAVATKYIGSLWGARAEGPRIAREVAVGMIPRGEVGIVVAGIALASGAVTEDVYAAVLGTVVVTTVVSPYLIKAVFTRRGHPGDDGGRRGEGRPAEVAHRQA